MSSVLARVATLSCILAALDVGQALSVRASMTNRIMCAADYIEKNGGLDTEADYPYWSVGITCNSLREER